MTDKEKNEMVSQTTTDRIQQMEQYMDEVFKTLKSNPNAVKEKEEIRSKIEVLTEYLDGGQWLSDYECDERGELPANLKRGVLSQDALYNLLCEIEEMENNKS